MVWAVNQFYHKYKENWSGKGTDFKINFSAHLLFSKTLVQLSEILGSIKTCLSGILRCRNQDTIMAVFPIVIWHYISCRVPWFCHS